MSPKVKSWLLLAGIFVIGAVTGGALTIGLGPHFQHPSQRPHSMKANWMEVLTKRLSLTPDQQTKIQPIVADADVKFQALFEDEKQQGSQIFKDADDKIEALLNPDQQAELKKIEAERQKMFHGHMHPGGNYGHGGEDQHQSPPAPPPPSDKAEPPPAGK